MFKRNKPLIIRGREITSPLAIKLAQHMTEDRAMFVAELRVQREYTWRMVAEECGQAWSKEWGADQDVGAALCALASAYFGEDRDYLDRSSSCD
jgi:hypothetical protein